MDDKKRNDYSCEVKTAIINGLFILVAAAIGFLSAWWGAHYQENLQYQDRKQNLKEEGYVNLSGLKKLLLSSTQDVISKYHDFYYYQFRYELLG